MKKLKVEFALLLNTIPNVQVFFSRLHFSAEDLLLYPSVDVRVNVSVGVVRIPNVRANYKYFKVLKF